ncbi:hypothetical protein KQX54_004428 [Cotesia glomerata]|uniref:Uncharacterized protein n=1 Tax=Cotesia glomerata TaxID=32391 RepID=A0AAV7I169_COTGL|nr:hypothetical protein KQX54_004428 [Cotesia glomerata]
MKCTYMVDELIRVIVGVSQRHKPAESREYEDKKDRAREKDIEDIAGAWAQNKREPLLRAAIMITMMMIGSMEPRGNPNRCWVIWIRPVRGPCDQDGTQLFVWPNERYTILYKATPTCLDTHITPPNYRAQVHPSLEGPIQRTQERSSVETPRRLSR